MGVEHTPGPWYVEKLYSNGCEVGPRVMTGRKPDGTRRIIAEIAGAPYMEDDEGEEIHANARLIAASPTLLAACHAILDDLDGESIMTVSINAVEKVRAAIREAEGRSL